MNLLALTLASTLAAAPAPTQPLNTEPVATPTPEVASQAAPAFGENYTDVLTDAPRKPFQSDHAFDSFASPLTDVILAKDPRSNTWARLLAINNNFPGSGVFQGGNAQIYALQVNVALSDRLAFIADKDGIARLDPTAGAGVTGLLNVAAGLKYTWYRDVANQALSAVGFQYELPTGGANVFQGAGDGTWYIFMANAKKFGDWQVLTNHGYQFPNDSGDQASFFYNAIHINRKIGIFYPLAELNWYKYLTEGQTLPPVVGEGEGLLNLGSAGVAGKDLVTVTAGTKIQPSPNYWLGFGYTIPLTNYKGILNNRIVAEAVLRY